MAAYLGKDFYLSFDGQVITSDNRTFDDGLSYDTVETSAAGNTVRSHRLSLIACEPKATFIVDSDATGALIAAKFKIGKTGQLIWGPQGNGTGARKYGITAVVTKAHPTMTYDGEQEWEIEWANTANDMLFNFDVSGDTF